MINWINKHSNQWFVLEILMLVLALGNSIWGDVLLGAIYFVGTLVARNAREYHQSIAPVPSQTTVVTKRPEK